MQYRTRFIIGGEMLNGKRGSLVIYAFTKQQAQDYANQHFKKPTIY